MVSIGLATHPGKVRPNNEDYAYHGPTPHGTVAIVCDGMGGHEAGEVAARLVAQATYEFITQSPGTDLEALVRDALLHANQRLLLYAQEHPQHKNLGSTAVVALLTPERLVYAHIGDSRLYAYDGKQLRLLTQDDSLVQQMLSSGLISAEQALHHPQKNVLSQSLGQYPPPTPHVGSYPITRRNAFLLCTDGLSNSLSQEELQTWFAGKHPDPQASVEALVQKALEQGGYDNITALLLIPPAKSHTFGVPMKFKLPPQKYLIGGGIAIGVLLLAVGFWVRKRPKSPDAGGAEVIVIDDSAATDTVRSLTEVPMEAEEPYEVVSPAPPPPPTQLPAVAEPSAPSPKASPTASPKTSTTSAAIFEYKIQPGDNLTQIAKAFSVSREQLRQLNNLKTDNIQSGKVLKIPVQATHTHTVQEKETLTSIAKKYRTTVEAIRRANGLEDEKIRKGQKLIIPVVKR